MILAILAIWYGYKKARDAGRNKFAWAAAAGGIYIGTQFLVAVAFGLLVAMGQELWGWDDKTFDKFSLLVSVVAVALSFIALLALFRYLDRVPSEPQYSPPPPPPVFEQTDQTKRPL